LTILEQLYTYESSQPEHRHVSAADSTVVTARIDAALKAKLEALSRTTKRSKSYLAAEAIAAYVELNEWQIAELEAGIAELDAGEVLSEEEAEERYRRLLQPL
jgi:RHH-type rel operon transcriptional repressor/antitoxin RelB